MRRLRPLPCMALALLAMATAIGLPNIWNARERDRYWTTVRNLQTARAALERYAEKGGRFPETAPLAPSASDLGVRIAVWSRTAPRPLSEIAPALDGPVPLVDGWGRPLLYESNGSEFLLLSTGRNRKLDLDTITTPGLNRSLDEDLVVSRGGLVKG